METKFNFKSQMCTTVAQSERLLALGLKKETADMCWQKTTLNGEAITYPSQDVWLNGSIITNNHFPAWSLHRLIILIGNIACDWIFRNDDCYTNAINCIEWLIKEGYFNKEYLV